MTELIREKKPPTDLAQFRKEWATLDAKSRVAQLLALDDTIRVVHALPVLDLFTTIHEVGRADCLEILELLHPKQVQGFLDLDGWRKDRLDAPTFGGWLEAFFAANPAQGMKQFVGLDIELISYLLKTHTHIIEVEAEEAPSNIGLHSVTPDNRYIIIFDKGTGSEKLLLGLKQAVELLYGRDLPFVLRLIEAVRWETASALEEESFRWRNTRLADMGFLDADRPGELFAYVDPDRFVPRSPTPTPPIRQDFSHDDPINYATSVLAPSAEKRSANSLFEHVLTACPPDLAERLSHELILLGNRAHLAEAGDLGDPDALRDTIQQVMRTCEIGMAYLSKGNMTVLVEMVAQHPLLLLFQIGHSSGLRLSRRLRTLIQNPKSGLSGFAILRVDSPLREVLAGLLRKVPHYYLGLTDPQRTDFRSFCSLQEIAETAKAVTEASFRAGLLAEDGFGITDEALRKAGLEDLTLAPPSSTLLCTLLANVLLEDSMKLAPMQLEHIQALRSRFKEEGVASDESTLLLSATDRDRIRSTVDAIAVRAFPLVGASSKEEACSRAYQYAIDALRVLQRELMHIEEDVPDLRFLRSIWTKEAYPLQADTLEQASPESGSQESHMSQNDQTGFSTSHTMEDRNE